MFVFSPRPLRLLGLCFERKFRIEVLPRLSADCSRILMARFDLDSDTRRKLGYRVIDQIDTFFSSLPDRPVQLPTEQRSYGALHDPLPEFGV